MSDKKNILRPFHLAFPIKNINKSKLWYTDVLGCSIGRESKEWVDFNFYGHQIVGHLSKRNYKNTSNKVDNLDIPVNHFGIILTIDLWGKLVKRLKDKNVTFLVNPYVRFKNKPGEQYTLFIKDPSGNALEFKAFKNDSMIFEN